jgi:hypothetical protein
VLPAEFTSIVLAHQQHASVGMNSRTMFTHSTFFAQRRLLSSIAASFFLPYPVSTHFRRLCTDAPRTIAAAAYRMWSCRVHGFSCSCRLVSRLNSLGHARLGSRRYRGQS